MNITAFVKVHHYFVYVRNVWAEFWLNIVPMSMKFYVFFDISIAYVYLLLHHRVKIGFA
jgi:hypothetical protein